MNASQTISALLLWAACVSAQAGQTFAGPYQVSAYQVLDGDTVRVVLPIWFRQTVQVDLRIRGIDAPETRRGIKGGQSITECELQAGKKAKAHLEAILKGKALRVSNITTGSYVGRAIGDITLPGGIDIAGLMISASHAVAYQYKKGRKPWDCSLSGTKGSGAVRGGGFKRSA